MFLESRSSLFPSALPCANECHSRRNHRIPFGSHLPAPRTSGLLPTAPGDLASPTRQTRPIRKTLRDLVTALLPRCPRPSCPPGSWPRHVPITTSFIVPCRQAPILLCSNGPQRQEHRRRLNIPCTRARTDLDINAMLPPAWAELACSVMSRP